MAKSDDMSNLGENRKKACGEDVRGNMISGIFSRFFVFCAPTRTGLNLLG